MDEFFGSVELNSMTCLDRDKIKNTSSPRDCFC